MASTISKENREALKKIAASAEPYADDDTEFKTLDEECDTNRILATLAKKVLDGKI